MDASQSALDSLRTVEFRETLKGYHRDDVDEYLEKAAVEAEGLQEQLRQSGERLRQAAERIAQLESAQEQQVAQPPAEPAVPDDTLQRTLLLAQKFVDETRADAEARASQLLADADAKARQLTEQAQARASQITADSEQRLREEISRLETARSTLQQQVENMTRHLESERGRLRTALGDILRWVDQNVQPTTGQDGGRPSATAERPPAPAPAADGPAPAADGPAPGPSATPGPAPSATPGPAAGPTPAPNSSPAPNATPAPNPAAAAVLHGGNRSAAPQGPATPRGSTTGPNGEVTEMHPTGVVTRAPDPSPPAPAPR